MIIFSIERDRTRGEGGIGEKRREIEWTRGGKCILELDLWRHPGLKEKVEMGCFDGATCIHLAFSETLQFNSDKFFENFESDLILHLIGGFSLLPSLVPIFFSPFF